MESENLPLEEHEKVLRELREKVFKHAISSDRPEVFILGGQPGSGKSTLLPLLTQPKHIITINGDEFRSSHPGYRRIMEKDPEHMAERTDPDVRIWTKELFDEAIRNHYNIVFESTMRQDEPLCTTLKTLRQEGYRITACVMTVHEFDSLARTERRYEKGMRETGHGRKVPKRNHDEAYRNMPNTLRRIENERLVDELRVYDSNQKLIYCGEDTKGQATTIVLNERERRGKELIQEAASAEPNRSYIGPVIGIESEQVFQRTEKGIVRHEISKLDKTPKTGDVLWIGYCKGKGFIRLAKGQELGRKLDRGKGLGK